MLPEIVYITQLDTGTRIALPLTPEKVSDKREGNFISYNVLNVGEVKIPNGEKLAQFSWNGILPGVSMLGMGIISLFDWKPPRAMIGILDGWKKNRKKLRLLVTGTAINHDVYIQNFTVTHGHFKPLSAARTTPRPVISCENAELASAGAASTSVAAVTLRTALRAWK